MARGGRRAWDEPDASPGVPALQIEPLLRALADHHVEFVIIGGFCLSAHGVIRATKDIDIMPNPRHENVRRVADALADLDAEPLLADDFSPAELGISLNAEGLARGGNWVLRTRLGRLDIMQAVEGVKDYADLRSRAVEVEVPQAGPFLFAGADDLIAMKLAAGRPQDLIDVTSLQRAHGA